MSDALPNRKGYDLHGEVVGDLLVEKFAGTSERGWVWDCTCLGCGAKLQRNGSQLREAARMEHVSACFACREQLRNGRDIERREIRMAKRQEYARTHGTWWSPAAVVYWMDRIADDLEKAGFTLLEKESIPSVGESWCPPDSLSVSAQRLAFIYPINLGEDRTIRCEDCNTYFEDGFGCVQCVQAVCRWCVEEEEHRCTPTTGGLTLLELGKALGVTKGRAGQLVDTALYKLRTSRLRSGTLEVRDEWRVFKKEYLHEG